MVDVIVNVSTFPMESELFVEGEMLPPVVASVVAYVLEGENPRRRRRRGFRGGRNRRGHRGGRNHRAVIQPSPMHEAYAYVDGDGKVHICSVDEVYDIYTGKWKGDPTTYVPLEHFGLASAEVSQYLYDLERLFGLEDQRDRLVQDENNLDRCERCHYGIHTCTFCRTVAKELARDYQELVTEMVTVQERISRVRAIVETAML